MDTLQKNKEVVLRFNKEVIEQGNFDSFKEIMDEEFVNQTAPPASNRADGMWQTLNGVLKQAFPDLRVEIYDQIAEGDKVTTRKALIGTHTGPLMGVSPTNKPVRIDVIDIVRIRNGKYLEHWGMNTLQKVVAELGNRSGE